MSLTPLQLTLAAAAIFVTHVVGAVGAYGSTLLALPLVYAATGDLERSVLVLLVVALVQAVAISWHTRGDIRWRPLAGMLLYAGAGVPVGIAGSGLLPERPLLGAMAGVLMLGGMVGLLDRPGWNRRLAGGLAGRALLLGGGVINGAFGSGGATVAVYAHHAFRDPAAFRGTLAAFWVVMGVATLGGRLAVGGRGPLADWWPLTLLAVPLVLVASWLGQRVAQRLPAARFRQWVGVLLLVAGVVTALRLLAG